MSYSWETRREGEPTADYLARVLEDSGLDNLAASARLKHYDDYFCPPEVDDGMNLHRLLFALEASLSPRARPSSQRSRRVRELQEAVKEGEFDGTKAESEIWAASDDGKATFKMLLDGT